MRSLDENNGRLVHWEESVRFAVGALASDKLKASLTMLGVVIGSAAIVLVVTIASSLSALAVLRKLDQLNLVGVLKAPE